MGANLLGDSGDLDVDEGARRLRRVISLAKPGSPEDEDEAVAASQGLRYLLLDVGPAFRDDAQPRLGHAEAREAPDAARPGFVLFLS